MSWNGSGTFNRIYSWVADAAAAINITASRMDADTNDITTNGFGNCLTRDGQGSATANLPMNGFRHTGVENGVNRTDYAALGQVQDGVGLNWTTAGGTSDALTATYTPALTALVDGQLCHVRAGAGNLTSTPTFAPNGLTAHTITKLGGVALAPGDIPGNLAEIILRYNLTNTRWELVNPPAVPVGGVVPYFGGTVPAGYALPTGQNLSAATYPVANAVLGTTYGSPGGGNFAMPDLRGRVFAHLDSGGSGRITVAGGNFDGTTLGDAGGGQNQTLTQAQLPIFSQTPTFSGTLATWNANQSVVNGVQAGGGGEGTGANSFTFVTPTVTITPAGTISAVTFGSGNSHPIVQPTMVINCMMRIA